MREHADGLQPHGSQCYYAKRAFEGDCLPRENEVWYYYPNVGKCATSVITTNHNGTTTAMLCV